MVEAPSTDGRSWIALDGDGWLVSTVEGVMLLHTREGERVRADWPHRGWVLFHDAVQVGPRLWRIEWEADLPSAALRAGAGGRRTTEVRA